MSSKPYHEQMQDLKNAFTNLGEAVIESLPGWFIRFIKMKYTLLIIRTYVYAYVLLVLYMTIKHGIR